MRTPFKITLALYGVVLVAHLALGQAVLSGVDDPAPSSWSLSAWRICTAPTGCDVRPITRSSRNERLAGAWRGARSIGRQP